MAPKKIQTSLTKSNNSQQNIANDLQLLQIENQELTKAIKDLYQRTSELLNSMEIIKSKNSALGQELALNPQLQQIQCRILQMEQIVQEIQNFGIRKTEQPQMLNDPMEIEKQTPTSEKSYQKILIPYRRIIICWYCQQSGHKVIKCFQFQQKQKKKIEKQWKNIFSIYCNQEGKIYRKKILQLTKKLQIFSTQQMSSIRNEWEQTYRKPLEKNQKYENL